MNLLTGVNGYYYGGRGFYWGFDPTYLLAILGLILTMIASAQVTSTFHA